MFSCVTCVAKQTLTHTGSTDKERIETTNTVWKQTAGWLAGKTQRLIERELVREVMGVQYGFWD